MDREKLFYNALALALYGDYREIAKRRRQAASWEDAYRQLPADRASDDPESEWEKLERGGIQLIFQEEPHYPALLREIARPPFGIYVRGTLPPADMVAVAIVGTRRGTPEGKLIARRFACELAGAGFVVVSGLALGIDAAAHTGALDATRGTTIAVLANGLDSFYPHTNERLGKQILERGGAIISEYPMGSPPLALRFLERNRIVSGLAKGVLVVESPKRSGSLATARFALEQNRDVFVVPGSITHSNFFGSHELIRQGAELVAKPEDILESYGIARKDAAAREVDDATPEEKLILQALRASSAPLDVDKIISITKLEPRIANQTTTFLLLKGFIKENESGYTI